MPAHRPAAVIFRREVARRMGEGYGARRGHDAGASPRSAGRVPSALQKIPIISAPGYPVSACFPGKIRCALLAAGKRLPPRRKLSKSILQSLPSKPGMEEHAESSWARSAAKPTPFPFPAARSGEQPTFPGPMPSSPSRPPARLNADEKVRAQPAQALAAN